MVNSEIIHMNFKREITDGTIGIRLKLFAPPNHSGTKLAVSFFINSPVIPVEGTNQNTVRYYNIISADGPGIRHVYWSEDEALTPVRTESGKIKDYQPGTVCTERNRNDDAFLHILTDQLFGQRVRVTLFEKDRTGVKMLEITRQDVEIKDNSAIVVFDMAEAYSLISTMRSTFLEGGDFDLIAKVEAHDSHIPIERREKQSEVLLLKFNRTSSSAKKSTMAGTRKFVIGVVQEEDNKKKEIKPMISPVRNYISTSEYGYRIHPTEGTRKFHTGIDLIGDLTIISPCDGKVIQIKSDDINGNVIYITDELGYTHIFCHLKDNSIKVSSDDIVTQGQEIATMGTTGRSTGVHLHYQINKGGQHIDPRSVNEGLMLKK